MQREVLEEIKSFHESSTVFSKGNEDTHAQCGNKGHDMDKCWQLIRHPSRHSRAKKFPQKKVNKKGTKNQKSSKFRGGVEKKTVAYVESVESKGEGAVTLSQQQIQLFLRLLPQLSNQGAKNEEEYKDFASNAFCSYVFVSTDAWILDTGATNHMSPAYKILVNSRSSKQKPHINMPDGSTIPMPHIGNVELTNGLQL